MWQSSGNCCIPEHGGKQGKQIKLQPIMEHAHNCHCVWCDLSTVKNTLILASLITKVFFLLSG